MPCKSQETSHTTTALKRDSYEMKKQLNLKQRRNTFYASQDVNHVKKYVREFFFLFQKKLVAPLWLFNYF